MMSSASTRCRNMRLLQLSNAFGRPPGLDKHGWGSSNRRSVVRRALRLRQFFADSLIK